jgi:hypothetical protein
MIKLKRNKKLKKIIQTIRLNMVLNRKEEMLG